MEKSLIVTGRTIVIDGETQLVEQTPTEEVVQTLKPENRAFFEGRIAALKEFMKSVPSGPFKHNLFRL